MKKVLSIFVILFTVSVMLFAQDTEKSDALKFEVSTVDAGNAKIEFSFNDLTGVLRVTYTLKTFIFNLGDADAAIRDAVLKFAEEKGYFKYRVYPEEDDVRYFQETRTTRYKKFFILYDKNRLE